MHRFKSQTKPVAAALGQEMVDFFKQSVAKRQTKLEKLAECWGRLVPEILSDHCALESLTRGTLTVVVDSSSHLYQLKTLLLAGIEQQLLIACKSAGLRKIMLRHGRWYEGNSSSDRKIRFSR
jgi:Dna[CI] antecedent, DciA